MIITAIVPIPWRPFCISNIDDVCAALDARPEIVNPMYISIENQLQNSTDRTMFGAGEQVIVPVYYASNTHTGWLTVHCRILA
jgi:hypothetical protein